MRPHRLVLQAFGPYAGREEVELDRLPPDALFLVHGSTGSGKTSVLDGICYALYGDTSGAERIGTDMRSDLALLDVPTEVQLDFSIGEDRYRVLRRPQQERPKKRGEGTTIQKPEATLWKLDGTPDALEAQVLADGERDTVQEIERRLGFESSQFRQVVVLPQGRFRELLSASSKDREAILETLFRTSHYTSIQYALKRRAVRLYAELDRLRVGRETVVQHLRADLDVPEEVAATTDTLEEALQRLEKARAAAEAEAAEDAKKLRTSRDALEAAKDTARRLDEAARARKHLASVEVRAVGVEADREVLAAARRALPLVELETKGKELADRYDRAKRTLQEAVGALRSAEEAAARAERVHAGHETSGAKESRARLEADVHRLEQLIPRADELLQARTQGVLLEKRRTRTRKEAHDQEIEAKKATARLEKARKVWEGATATRLASSLEDGEPCPVCGSRDHPAPAHGKEGALDEAALRALEREEKEALEVARKARAKAGKAEADHRAAATKVDTLSRDLPSELEAPESIRDAWQKLRHKAAAEQKAVETARTKRDEAVRAKAAAEAAHVAAKSGYADRDREVEAARAVFADRLRDASFEDLAAYRGARRKADEIEAMDAAVRAFEKERAAAKGAASKADRAAEGLAPPEVEARTLAYEEVAERTQRTTTLAGAMQERVRRATAGLQDLLRRDGEAKGVEAEYAVAGRLSRLAVGENARNLSFQRFVLGALLDEVLEVASRRLLDMSRGRYRLTRRADPTDRRKAAGLELDVDDGWTGQLRPASTLSGGEGFQAALALALGLADVVQRHSGGTRLDALFIDEGFGSLDPEALDLAIDTLMTLREGGRLVGIISHVPELKERIDVRLEVVGGPQGSRTKIVLP